jgi:hypothetical protein
MAQVVEQAPAPPEAAGRPVAERPARDLPSLLVWAAVLLALLPIVTGTVRAISSDWFPIGDNGVVYARTTDVFTDDSPLLYMWSAGSGWAEEDFNNPGPTLYWIFAVPTTVFGPSGMVVATALLNAAAIVGLALVGLRRGGPLVGVAVVAVAAVLSWSMGSALLVDPWAPNSLLLPTLLYLALAWSVVDRDLLALPFVAGVGSLLLQSNLSYALLAPGLALFAAVVVGLHLWRERRRDAGTWPALRRRVRRVGWATAGVLVVAWTPAVVEQLTAEGTGNLTRIARGMGELPLSVGPERALQLVAGVVALPSWLSRGSFDRVYKLPPSTAAAVAVAVAVAVVLGGLAWLGVRHRDRVAVAGIATAGCALVLAFITTARSPVDGFGELIAYRIRYLWAVAAFAVLAALVAALRRLPQGREPRLGGAAVLVAVTAVAAVANVPAHWVVGGNHEPSYAPAVVRDLRPQLASVDPDQKVLFDFRGDSFNYPFWAYAVIAELTRRDVPLRFHDEHLIRTLGEERRYEGDGNADVLMTVRTGEDAYRVPEGARRIALREGLHREELEELRAVREELIDAFDSGEVHLTPEGERTLARLGDDGAQQDEASAGRRLVEGLHVRTLLLNGFLDLAPAWESRIWIYVDLEDRFDDRTVGVFVRPLGTGGD